MEKKNKLTIEQARQIESLLSEYGIDNILDCDFSDLALFTFADFFKDMPRVVAFLSEAVTKVGNNPTKTAIEGLIKSICDVSFTLSKLLYFYQPLTSVSKLILDTYEILNDGEKTI